MLTIVNNLLSNDYQIATPNFQPVPVVAVVVQILRHHIGVKEGLVHALLAMLVVSCRCHVPARPPASPVVPGQRFIPYTTKPIPGSLRVLTSLEFDRYWMI